jgi:hypothetical protein
MPVILRGDIFAECRSFHGPPAEAVGTIVAHPIFYLIVIENEFVTPRA